MKQIYRYSSFVLMFLFLGIYPNQVHAQELEDYLQIAAKNNPKLNAAYSQFEAAMQKAPQVASLPDPTFTVSAFGRMMETRLGAQEARFTLMQMFPWFGTLKANENASVLMAEASFQQYINTRNELFFDVKSLYADLYAIDQIIKIKEDNLSILESYRDLALSRFKSGASPMVNVVKIDINTEAALTEIELLKEQREPLLYRLNLMLNRNLDEVIKIPDTLKINIYESPESFENLFQDHPLISGFQKQEEAYEVQQEIADKNGMPMIGIGVDYSIISKRTDANPPMNGQDAIMPMLSVSLPIFRKKYKAARSEAEFMSTSVAFEREAVSNELKGRYAKALYDLNSAVKLLNLYNRQITSSNQANNLQISAFSNATGGFEEVLEMNQDILMLQTQKIETLKNAFIAQAEIEYLLSKTEY